MAEPIISALRDPKSSRARACPRATQDISVNLQNRQKAIQRYGYGPMNPNEPNEEFWAEKARMWGTTPQEAMSARCGNCGAFDRSPMMLRCIENGIGYEGDPNEVVKASELGYCEFFDFKCAASRTCNAWVAKNEK